MAGLTSLLPGRPPGSVVKRKLARSTVPTGVERHFDANEVIVSKTDLKGRITYANRVFIRIAGFGESELIGAPHSIIRHPDMPRSVFKLLWDTIEDRREIFAYVINLCRNGDYYWVLAHVTPSFDPSGRIVGYHSNRRKPDRAIIDRHILPLYRQLKAVEDGTPDRKAGMAQAAELLAKTVSEKGMSYDELVFSL